MLLPPAGQAAFRETHRMPRWQAWVASDANRERGRLEDSWRIVAGGAMAGTAWDAFAVFDGVGGRANAQQAAWAAAANLPQAMRRADAPASLLRELDLFVRHVGGAATAAILLADRLTPEAWLVGVGDCSVHRLAGGRVASLLEHDRAGRNLVTDCLGIGFRQGRALPVQVALGEALLLCSDGVEEAGLGAVRRCLEAPPEGAAAALEELIFAARRAGSADDATALLVRRG